LGNKLIEKWSYPILDKTIFFNKKIKNPVLYYTGFEEENEGYISSVRN
jgi:hypothetical protein